ncbi:MAG TPA: glycosyltransferase [Thermomicrobiales bacterium]|nr:glycosyltransferase [Thermomicrobiales bacterium]
MDGALRDEQMAAAMPAAVVWSAPLLEFSGYADEARNFVFALDRAGVPVSASSPLSLDDAFRQTPADTEWLRRLMARRVPERFVYVSHVPGRLLARHPLAARNIGRTMLETDRLPPSWVDRANRMDEVWVPSDYNIETFAHAGVDSRKLRKVPEALSLDLFDPSAQPLALPGLTGFIFLSVFGWSLRKGWDVLVRAYVEEFRYDEPVTLAIKAFPPAGQSVSDLRETINAYVRSLGRDPKRTPHIALLALRLRPADMPRLYRSADAYVLPSRGEGWGRPYMEAMAMGLPAIATRATGNLEFMTDSNSWLVDAMPVDVPPAAWHETPCYRGHRWVEPSVEQLRAAMRQVFEGSDVVRAKAALGREQVRASYGWDSVARIVIERLAESGLDARRPSPSRRPRVTWEGGLFSNHSYAIVNRHLCRALIDSARVDLSLVSTSPVPPEASHDPALAPLVQRVNSSPSPSADVHISLAWPPRFDPPPSGRWVIVQPWDFGSLPKAWIDPLNRLVDEVWVPSSFVLECYLRSGVDPSKVHVVPLGVDPRRFHPGATPLDLPTTKSFRILFVGGTIPRKGIGPLIETYLETFSAADDVCFVIKDTGADTFYRGQGLRDDIRQLQSAPGMAEILYIDQDLPDDAMPGLYTACHALAHPYRSEGYGLPIVEAMACGLPVIVPHYGGALDYCDETICHFVPGYPVAMSEARVGDLETVEKPWWLAVDQLEVARALMRMVDNPATAREMGLRASARVLRDVTWERAAAIALDRIEALAMRPSVRLQPARPAASAPATRTQLSVCMIVKDEERMLPRALASVRGLADELVVVDTGSTDRTVEIAREHGARVFHFPWTGDWAEARNESLRHATKDWILVLDADQEIDAASHAEIRRLMQLGQPNGYMLRQLNHLDDESNPSLVEHLVLRLFPNRHGLRYEGIIHEQVVSNDPQRPLRAVPSAVVVHHYGCLGEVGDPVERATRYLSLIERQTREQPDAPFHAYNMGLTLRSLGRHQDAATWLERAIQLWARNGHTDQQHCLASAHLTRAHSLAHLGRDDEAAGECEQALRFLPDFSDAHCALGVMHARRGRYDDALASYARALACAGSVALIMTDRSTAGWRPLFGMGETHLARGDWEAAHDCLSRAAALAPRNPGIQSKLAYAAERLAHPAG